MKGDFKIKFSDKLKQLRKENNLTQDDLAEKIFVTRTAISKWETDKGLPSIDILKAISNLFNVSIDDLISDKDIEIEKIYDEKKSKQRYIFAITCLILSTISILFAYILQLKQLNTIGIIFAILYCIIGLSIRPRYKKVLSKKSVFLHVIFPYIISRIVILLFVIGMIIYTIVQL